MLYSILIYGSESRVAEWTAAEKGEVMGRHAQLREDLTADGRLGPVLRLSAEGARTVRRYKDRHYITDGPYAETKEQLGGFYLVDCPSLDEAIEASAKMPVGPDGSVEIRPIMLFDEEGQPSS